MKFRRYAIGGLLVIAVIMFGSCGMLTILGGVWGSGNIMTEGRSVGAFTGVQAAGAANVSIVPAGAYRVEITTDDNLLPYITTEVTNGVLVIGTRPGTSILHSTRMDVFVSLPMLDSVQVSGSGGITLSAIAIGSQLIAAVSGSGSITGTVDGSSAESNSSGSGRIVITGRATNEKVAISGSGNVNERNLIAQYVSVLISGSGSAWVNATNSLTGTISGSGNIYCKGGASKSVFISGSGTVIGY